MKERNPNPRDSERSLSMSDAQKYKKGKVHHKKHRKKNI